MAIYREDIVDIDLKSGSLFRSFFNRQLGEGDISGDLFGVRLFRYGEPESLTGVSCVGYFIKPDGDSVTITGGRSGNLVYVILPESCYVTNGQFQLTIKITNGEASTTVRIVDGTIIDTILGNIIDPGTVIPDLSEFEALVERAEAAAETIEGFSITNTLLTGTRYRIDYELTT